MVMVFSGCQQGQAPAKSKYMTASESLAKSRNVTRGNSSKLAGASDGGMKPSHLTPPSHATLTRTPPKAAAGGSAAAPTPSSQPVPDMPGWDTAEKSKNLRRYHAYVVREGDTNFQAVAKKIYGDSRNWKAIAKANPKVDGDKLRPGQVILVPPPPENLAPTTTPATQPEPLH